MPETHWGDYCCKHLKYLYHIPFLLAVERPAVRTHEFLNPLKKSHSTFCEILLNNDQRYFGVQISVKITESMMQKKTPKKKHTPSAAELCEIVLSQLFLLCSASNRAGLMFLSINEDSHKTNKTHMRLPFESLI